jgi:hypothetical protein
LSFSNRFEAYLAGSILLLLGLLLLLFLTGLVAIGQLPALFLLGIGVIFLAMALLKWRAPAAYEMPPRATLAYGTIAVIIGVLWLTVSIQATLAGYILAAVLVFFGLIFLAYTRIKRSP